MICGSIEQLKKCINGTLKINGSDIHILDEANLRNTLIDDLIRSAVFSPDSETKNAARWIIRKTAAEMGIMPASIQPLYEAMGRKELSGFTVPAINLRGITYYSAQAVFRAAIKKNVGTFIFEIARSEIDYTDQRPSEYAAVIIAAAIKAGYTSPVFIQGDHFQINSKKYALDPQNEVESVKSLIVEAMNEGFFNIDIDASTLADLSRNSIKEQHKENYTITADMTAMIRNLEPEGITVSVGGEIGEIGDKNTTVEEFDAFMEGYLEQIKKKGEKLKGISKISIQTGTTHGGVPLPDGSIAKAKIDFETLRNISEVARSKFGLCGAVQHGASTLPDEAFGKFPETGTAEVHLATGFQNMIYDSRNFPKSLKDKIYEYIKTELGGEKKEGNTEEQFIYKTRKKGFGRFKEDMWNLSPDIMEAIGTELENKFLFLFDKLNVGGTRGVVESLVKITDVSPNVPESLK